MIQAPPGRSLLADSEWPMLLGAGYVILAAIALISIWISRNHRLSAKVIWTIVVVLLPIAGAAGWFVLGRQGKHVVVDR